MQKAASVYQRKIQALEQRFLSTYRLTGKNAFSHVFDDAQALRTPALTVLVRENKALHARIGFIIKRKQISRAVQRNRARRLTKEAFRQSDVKKLGIDIVVIINQRALKFSNAELTNQVQSLWKKCLAKYSK